MKHFIAVEGNIGSGKTELLRKIQVEFGDNISCRKEPQGIWKTSSTKKDCEHNLLDGFYQDTKRWSFCFEVKCLYSRIMDYKKSKKNITFCERSWTSDRFIYVETLHDNKCISDMEKELYEDIFDYHQRLNSMPQISCYIYMRTEPNTCYDKISSETKHIGIELSYLEQLHEKHENVFGSGTFKDHNDDHKTVVIVEESDSDDIIFKKIRDNLCFM